MSVDKFYIQWRESCVLLDELMAEMNAFYCDCAPEYDVNRTVGITGKS